MLSDVINSNFKKLNRLTKEIQQRNATLLESSEDYNHQSILDTFLPQLETYYVAFKRERQKKKLKSDFLRKPADLVLGFYEIGS